MSPRTRLFVATVSTVLVGYVAVGSLLGRVMGDTTYGQLALFNEVVRLVLDAYVDPVNVDRAMNGARMGLTEALDGDSAWLDAEDLKAVQDGDRGDAEVGLLLTRRLGFLMVVSTREGSPAQKAGLRPGDIVKSIDGRHTRPLSPVTGHRLLRGAPGSVVKLVVLRASTDPIDMSLVRERPATAAVRARVLEPGVGYVKVPEFTAKVAEDVRAELDGLRKQGARHLVLDLRGSAFGPLTEAPRVAELFLKGGVVAKVSGAKQPEQVLTADAARSAWDRPVTVLVDHGTAGAAEVVAAALLESGRALVGQSTFGRAPVQKTVTVPDGALLLTVARYHTPKGAPIHGKGLAPTVAVRLSADDEEEGEGPAGDPILEKALELIRDEGKKAA
ncbi:MAG TPA: S41 family peptidase [Vicinamibacteria bacterium]|nr:S41 family peptidase [Vicinamibacteria bacterium]